MRPSITSSACDASRVARLCLRCHRREMRRVSSLTTPRSSQSRVPATTTIAAAAVAPRVFVPSPAAHQFSALPRTFSSQPATATEASPETAAATPASSQIQSHYDLFPETLPDGPPPSGHFPIDTRALRREFLQLQARAHPDRHPQALKARAEATSARINEAFKTLANPLLRAQYLLSLRGIDVAEDENLRVEDEPALLMTVLEAREEIEDAADEQDLEGPRLVNDERIAASEAALEQAFRNDDMEMAKREAVRLRYWVNIKDSLDNWEMGKPVVLQH